MGSSWKSPRRFGKSFSPPPPFQFNLERQLRPGEGSDAGGRQFIVRHSGVGPSGNRPQDPRPPPRLPERPPPP